MREKLLESCRSVGRSLLSLLGVAQSPNASADLNLPTEAAVDLKSNLLELKNIIRDSENPRSEEDLETVAERELIQAANSIEAATQVLIVESEKRELAQIPGVPDVAGRKVVFI